jgi:hypothetical protein
MLIIGRRFIVAVLATALSSQLAQEQLLRCDRMDMGATAAMESMSGSGNDEHDVTVAPSGRDSQDQMPVSSSCIVSTICLVGPAIPTVSAAVFDASPVSRVIASAAVVPATRALRPDLPPPRF